MIAVILSFFLTCSMNTASLPDAQTPFVAFYDYETLTPLTVEQEQQHMQSRTLDYITCMSFVEQASMEVTRNDQQLASAISVMITPVQGHTITNAETTTIQRFIQGVWSTSSTPNVSIQIQTK